MHQSLFISLKQEILSKCTYQLLTPWFYRTFPSFASLVSPTIKSHHSLSPHSCCLLLPNIQEQIALKYSIKVNLYNLDLFSIKYLLLFF